MFYCVVNKINLQLARLWIIIIMSMLPMIIGVHQALATPDLCGFYSRDLEEKYYLPHNLLQAIAVVETGKYDRANHKREAWAWTVSNNGTNKMKYASKALAIKHILNLQKAKQYDINVGCLQLNYQLYSSALGKPYTALSPAVNMKYGAKLLKEIYDKTQDWKISVGFFHQANYKKADKNYYGKIQKAIHNLNNYEHNQQERKRSHRLRNKSLREHRNDRANRKIKRKNYSVGKPNLGGRYEKENRQTFLQNFGTAKTPTKSNDKVNNKADDKENHKADDKVNHKADDKVNHKAITQDKSQGDKSQGYTPQPLDTKRTEELNKLNQQKFKSQHPNTTKLYRHHSNEAPTIGGGSSFFNQHRSK